MHEKTKTTEKLQTRTKIILAAVFAATILFPLYIHLKNNPTLDTTTPPKTING